jgi:hypothetical protein
LKSLLLLDCRKFFHFPENRPVFPQKQGKIRHIPSGFPQKELPPFPSVLTKTAGLFHLFPLSEKIFTQKRGL